MQHRILIYLHGLNEFHNTGANGIHKLVDSAEDITAAIEQATRTNPPAAIHLYTSTPSVPVFRAYLESVGYVIEVSSNRPGNCIVLMFLDK